MFIQTYLNSATQFKYIRKLSLRRYFCFQCLTEVIKVPKYLFLTHSYLNPPENNKILWFSGVFRGYKMRTLARKELIKLEAYSSTLLKKDSVKGLEFLRYCKATFRSLFRIQSNILVHSFSMHPFSTP